MTLTEILSRPAEFRYMLLDRMRQDCEYFLGARYEKYLWAGSVSEQIKTMRAIYKSLPEAPQWLTMEEMDEYAKAMQNPMKTVKITYSDGDTTVTDISNKVTDEEIRRYFRIGAVDIREYETEDGYKEERREIVKVEIFK